MLPLSCSGASSVSTPRPLRPRPRSRCAWRRSLGWSIPAAIALWLLIPVTASAHAHLVRANPAPNAVIARAPAVASFVFDQPLNPALTSVRIVNAAGRQVAGERGHLAPGHDGELWRLPLPPLPSGVYSVLWTSQSSADGHILSSFYTFRVAPPGSAVPRAALGTSGAIVSAEARVNLGAGALATALWHWLGLSAQALWLGALIVEIAVLVPVRRGDKDEAPEMRLSRAAAPRLRRVVRVAIAAALFALLGEVASLALQGTGGDWSRALSPAVIGGILSSRFGHFVMARVATLGVALLLAASAPASIAAASAVPVRRHPSALGIVAPWVATPRWSSPRVLLAILAVDDMLLIAYSGHAADVTPGWLSYPIDWLHLLCTGAWAGGIAALATGVLPARCTLPPARRAPAVLVLLDRFSPVAYAAAGVLALSGFYNAVSHLSAPAELAGTTYGQLLVLKLALAGLLMALSATHVYGLRPRLSALVLFQTALFDEGQTRDDGSRAHHSRPRPAVGAYRYTPSSPKHSVPPDSALFGTDGATNMSGAGEARIAARIHSGLRALSGLILLEAVVGAGILLVTALMGQTLPPDGPAVAASASAPASAVAPRSITGTTERGDLRGRLTISPPALGATTFSLRVWENGEPVTEDDGACLIHLYPVARPSLRANLTLQGNGAVFSARGSLAANGAWRADVLVRTARFDDYRTLAFTFTAGPNAGFTASSASGPVGSAGIHTAGGQGIARSASHGPRLAPAHRVPYNVAVARALPYTAVVSEIDANGIRPLGGALIKTGPQAYGIGIPAGSRYAYVTNFGAARGSVSQVDLRTRRVVRTFATGLGPAHIAFAPDGRRAFVADLRSNDVSVIDLVSGLTRRITFPDNYCFEPNGIDVSGDGRTLYVACAGGSWIYTAGARTLRPGRVILTGRGAFGVAVDRPRHEVWVTNQSANTVTVLDEKTLAALATIHVGQGPALLAPSPDGRTMYVADQLSNTVSVIDAASRRVTATIPVARQPHGVSVTADGKYVYVASIAGHAVTIIRASDDRVVAIVPSPAEPNEVAVTRSP